jgi:peptide/nickel transport system substrate-binding protein
VRRALSMAIDRQALANTAFNGAAEPSRTLVTHENYGYAKDVFDEHWDELGEPKVDVDGAKKLIEAAKPSGTVVFAYPTGGASYNDQVALAVQSAAKDIGLDLKLKGMPQDTYNAQLFDRAALLKSGIDMAETSWFIDVPEPLIMYEQFLPGVSVYNLGDWKNQQVIDLVDKASQTADETKRAEMVVEIEKIVDREMPWIPLVQTANLLFMNNRISGAPASFVQNYYPWAADIGGR